MLFPFLNIKNKLKTKFNIGINRNRIARYTPLFPRASLLRRIVNEKSLNVSIIETKQIISIIVIFSYVRFIVSSYVRFIILLLLYGRVNMDQNIKKQESKNNL